MFVQFGALSEEALVTAEYAEFFDKLFNAFNSSSIKHTAPMRHAVTGVSGHMRVFDTALQKLSFIRSKYNNILPCVDGWIQNINALRLLWFECQLQFLFTARLNQDCIENLFSQVRGKGAHRDNPNPQQFRAAFRDLLVDALVAQSKGSN